MKMAMSITTGSVLLLLLLSAPSHQQPTVLYATADQQTLSFSMSRDLEPGVFENGNEWLIKTNLSGKVVKISVLYTRPPSVGDCTSDYVQVYDGDNTLASKLGTFCGKQPLNFTSSSDSMYLQLIIRQPKCSNCDYIFFNLRYWARDPTVSLALIIAIPFLGSLAFVTILGVGIKCWKDRASRRARRMHFLTRVPEQDTDEALHEPQVGPPPSYASVIRRGNRRGPDPEAGVTSPNSLSPEDANVVSAVPDSAENDVGLPTYGSVIRKYRPLRTSRGFIFRVLSIFRRGPETEQPVISAEVTNPVHTPEGVGPTEEIPQIVIETVDDSDILSSNEEKIVTTNTEDTTATATDA